MLRTLSRMIGYALLAGAFIAIVVDGTRSIAASSLVLTPVQSFVERLSATVLPALRQSLLQLHAALWDPVAVTLLKTPLAAALLVIGVLFVALAAGGREPSVGVLSRR